MGRLRLPRRASRNAAHESTVTRPHSAPSANTISNFPEADFWPGTTFVLPVTHAEPAIAAAPLVNASRLLGIHSAAASRCKRPLTVIVVTQAAHGPKWMIIDVETGGARLRVQAGTTALTLVADVLRWCCACSKQT